MRGSAGRELHTAAVTHSNNLRFINTCVFLSIDALHNLFSCDWPLKLVSGLHNALYSFGSCLLQNFLYNDLRHLHSRFLHKSARH